ncbi:MAG: hypothetical protein ACK5WS_04530 [Alphaproteobacteria bacterium]|jgi:hypothetical protein|nr:hypothetical protein [Candidatus Jidaibacter sp.]
MTRFFISLIFAVIFLQYQDAICAVDHKNYILPEETRMYLSESGDLAEVQIDSSYREIVVPMINYYKGEGGCYLVCYSVDSDHSAYPLGNGNYVVGQIRMDGKYFGSKCVSKVAVNFDAMDVCHDFFSNQCFANSCWIGSETGAWFGLD